MPAQLKTTRFTAFIIGVSGIFLLTGCHSQNRKNQQNNTDSITVIALPKPGLLPPEEAGRIRNYCQAWYDSVLLPRGFNGGILVAKEGNIVFEKYRGTGHIPGNDWITDSTPMHIASVSKTFTAMAVLKLQQDGKLMIDDLLSKYLPGFNYPGITIRMLLNHRSGLPNYNYFMDARGWDKNRFVKNEDVLDYLVNRKDSLPETTLPGRHFSYCNTNYALLALLIEKITGLTYATYLRRTFFIPLQMKNTYVFTLADTLKAIPSYNWRGAVETFNYLDQVYGDKNIYSTPRDLLLWDRALRSGLLFTPETLNQAYAPYSNEKPGVRNYGLGWRMNIFPGKSQQEAADKIIYHNGWWHGSNASFIRLIRENATIIVIGNKFNRAIYHAKVLASCFGNYYPAAEEEENTMPADSFKVETGKMNPDTVSYQLTPREFLKPKKVKDSL